MLDLFRLSILWLNDYFSVFLSWLIGHHYAKWVLSINHRLILSFRSGFLSYRLLDLDILKDLVGHLLRSLDDFIFRSRCSHSSCSTKLCRD